MTDLMDIPNLLAEALETTTMVSGLILSCCVLMTVAMIFALLKLELVPMVIVLLAFSGLLTAIGWLYPWFMIIAVLTVCALVGARFASGGSPSE